MDQSAATTVQIAKLPDAPLDRALMLAGKNRPEIEAALQKWPADTENHRYVRQIIGHMRPYDLANVSTAHLVDNVEFATLARKEAPWGREISDELFEQWVLPYRVADEELDSWRRPFHERFWPLVKAERDTKSAIQKLYTHYHKGNGGKALAGFVVTENRDQAPRQLLDHTQRGRCFELNLCFVAMARSVGVPIRHCGAALWSNRDQYHYWVEFWNTGLKKWERLDASQWVTGKYFMADKHAYGAAYALPPYPQRRDQVGAEYFHELIPITEQYRAPGKVRALSRVDAAPGRKLSLQAYVWNSSTWRPIADAWASEFKAASFELGPSRIAYPYLLSANSLNGISVGLGEVTPGKSQDVLLKTMLENESVSIPLSKNP